MATAALKMVTLDSSDVRRDVAFWHAVLGWEVAHEQDEYGMLTSPDGLALGFGLVEGYEAPGWPNEHGSKQFHLDLAVDDLDAAAEEVVGHGGHAPGGPARRDLARAARPERPPVLPHPGGELGLSAAPPLVAGERPSTEKFVTSRGRCARTRPTMAA